MLAWRVCRANEKQGTCRAIFPQHAQSITFDCFDNYRNSPFGIILCIAKVTVVHHTKHSCSGSRNTTLYREFYRCFGSTFLRKRTVLIGTREGREKRDSSRFGCVYSVWLITPLLSLPLLKYTSTVYFLTVFDSRSNGNPLSIDKQSFQRQQTHVHFEAPVMVAL